MNRIQHLMEQIRTLETELASELHRKEKDFFYRIRGAKVIFDPATASQQKAQLRHLFRFLISASFLNILTAPIIWACIIPIAFLDVMVSMYQAICFRVYGIPRVKRSEYVVFDHQFLAYLNPVEKINCMYCSYANGLIAYAQEIAARTEQYWCPIKHARRVLTRHSRYHRFFDYGDVASYRKDVEQVRRDFMDLEQPAPGAEEARRSADVTQPGEPLP